MLISALISFLLPPHETRVEGEKSRKKKNQKQAMEWQVGQVSVLDITLLAPGDRQEGRLTSSPQ